MLGVVGSNLTIFKLEPTTPIIHHVATHRNTVAKNTTCCAQQCWNMLCWHVTMVWLGLYILAYAFLQIAL